MASDDKDVGCQIQRRLEGADPSTVLCYQPRVLGYLRMGLELFSGLSFWCGIKGQEGLTSLQPRCYLNHY